MKKLLLTTLFTFICINITLANDKVIGIWASPTINTAKIIWYLYPNGDVLASTNASYNEHKLKWKLKGEQFVITPQNTLKHKWNGTLTNENISGKHYYRHRDGKKWSVWNAEKYSDDYKKKINFYELCNNSKNNVWRVVNVGNLKHCGARVSGGKSTSFSYDKVKNICIEYSRKFLLKHPNKSFKCE